jgi:hypothetical protein
MRKSDVTDDLAWWQSIFEPIGVTVTGWTYRSSALVMLPSGRYIDVDGAIVELIGCAQNAADTSGDRSDG